MSNGSYELHVSQFYTERDQRRIVLTKIYIKPAERDQRHIMCTKIYTKYLDTLKLRLFILMSFITNLTKLESIM